MSPDHRASIGRRSPDGRSMTFYQRTVGRQTLDIGRQSADDRPTVDRSYTLVYVILFRIDVSTLFMKLNHSIILLSPRNSVGGDIVTRPFVGGWVSEWVRGWVRACVGESVVPSHSTLWTR